MTISGDHVIARKAQKIMLLLPHTHSEWCKVIGVGVHI